MEYYKKTKEWTYLREKVYTENTLTQRSGAYRIITGINRPRHVFIFIIDVTSYNDQTRNKFLYNTFNPGGQLLTSCHLEVGNGTQYPRVQYEANKEPTRVFRDIMKYVHANSKYADDTLLNRANFNGIFSMVYFDLTKQPLDIKDGSTKLIFKYDLAAAANAYRINALVLHEQDVEIRNMDGKVIMRSKNESSYMMK